MIYPEIKILRDNLTKAIGVNGKLIRIIRGKEIIIEIQSDEITRLETTLKILLAARDKVNKEESPVL